MKIKVTKSVTEEVPAKKDGEEKPADKDVKDVKKKKVKLKDDKPLATQYGLYSGIVTEKGSKSNPTTTEAITNMVNYMKNNRPPQADNPSNVYRPQFSHLTIAYDKNKKQSNA